MGKGIAISPIRTRAARVLNKGNIQGELKSGNHKAKYVKARKAELKKLSLEQQNILLQEKMYQKLFDTVEEIPSGVGEKLNTIF